MHSTVIKYFKKSFIVTMSMTVVASGTLCEDVKAVNINRLASINRVVEFTNKTIQEEIEPVETHVNKISDFRYHWSEEEIQHLMDTGILSETDYLYLTAVGMECPSSYDGFLAVARCVLNRLENKDKYSSVRDVVTEDGQFTGYNDPYTHHTLYKRYCTEFVKDAAVDALLGVQSPIGDCEYFFCPIDEYDVWADGNISEFWVIEGNVFFRQEDLDKHCGVHNKKDCMDPEEDILIWDHTTGKWLFETDYHYVR